MAKRNDRDQELGFIFDLDGTIVDSTAHYRAAWQEFIEEFGSDEDPDSFLRRATRENLTQLLGEDATPQMIEQTAARHAARGNAKMRADGVQAHDGVVELVRDLHANRFKLALATAAERSNAEWTLQELGIRELFDTIVVDRDVARGKPAPDIYLEALRRLNLESNQCAVMEDSATGIRAARAAGLRVIAVETTHARHELEQAGANLIITRATELTTQDVVRFILSEGDA